MTITADGKRPCFHPDQWSDEFRKLYEAFTNECAKLDPPPMITPDFKILAHDRECSPEIRGMCKDLMPEAGTILSE
ncbi:MAG: hypothetical protein ABSD49_02000 [Candidatus Bathyarchaeia archaeon]